MAKGDSEYIDLYIADNIHIVGIEFGVEGSREKLVGASCPPSFYLIKINLALTCRSETFSLGNQLLLLWAVHLSSTL